MRKKSIGQKNKDTLISIVIPVFNEEKNLPRLFKSFEKLSTPKRKFEVIIVDGGSTDKTIEIAKKFGAKIFHNPLKLRGAGCQIGIKKAKGEYIAFTDADCVVRPDWLISLVRLFTKDNIVSVGGPNLTPKDDTNFSKAFGEVLSLLTRAGSRYGYSGKLITDIFHNSGCNVLYKKKAIESVGGFNLSLITCEDEELDFRLREKGFRLLFTPTAIVDHYRRPTYKKIYIQAYRYAMGRAQAIKIHFQMVRWFHFIPTLLLLFFLLSIFSHKVFLFQLFDIFVLFVLLGISFYLSLTKGFVHFYIYFLMLILWLMGWGLGFIKGFFLTQNRYFRKSS